MKKLQARAEVEGQFPGDLDFSAYYLDDRVAAGMDRAVAMLCSVVNKELADIGLELSVHK